MRLFEEHPSNHGKNAGVPTMNQQPLPQAFAQRLNNELAPRPVLLTVAQLSERNPAFTPAALRNIIFKAEARQSSCGEIRGNGLAETGAIIRLGRRVLIDESKFLAWVTRARDIDRSLLTRGKGKVSP
jgi:hypothetical protein